MLLRQDGGRHEERHLLAVHHSLKGRAQSDLCFAVAHVAAEQAVHHAGGLHVLFDLRDAGELIRRFFIWEAFLQPRLPRGIR